MVAKRLTEHGEEWAHTQCNYNGCRAKAAAKRDADHQYGHLKAGADRSSVEASKFTGAREQFERSTRRA